MGSGLGGTTAERVFYGGQRTPTLGVIGATEQFATVNFVKLSFGRFFTQAEVLRRRRVVVLGNNPYQALFAPSGLDPIGKKVRIGAIEYTIVGVLEKRPSPFPQADDFVVIPQTTHQVVFATNARQRFGGGSSAQITIVPAEGATRDQAAAEVEEIMRIRHGLKLDEPNDFELGDQDAILRLWDQISRAVVLALVVISSVALMVGGIGVMAIMMISVTERTREIGVRKALGARRQEILFQFLAEAAVLTSVGGVLGILRGRHRAGPSVWSPASRSRCRGGRSRSAWAFGERRYLLRHGARRARVASRSDRGPPLRVKRGSGVICCGHSGNIRSGPECPQQMTPNPITIPSRRF